jgi:hypothetical protein
MKKLFVSTLAVMASVVCMNAQISVAEPEFVNS